MFHSNVRSSPSGSVVPEASRVIDSPGFIVRIDSPLIRTTGGWFASLSGFTHQFNRAAKSAWNAGRQRYTEDIRGSGSLLVSRSGSGMSVSWLPSPRKRPPQLPSQGRAGSDRPLGIRERNDGVSPSL